MIAWGQKDLIGKANPRVAMEELDKLSKSVGWSLVVSALREVSHRHGEAMKRSIRLNEEQVYNANLNYHIYEILKSVATLPEEMMSQCERLINCQNK